MTSSGASMAHKAVSAEGSSMESEGEERDEHDRSPWLSREVQHSLYTARTVLIFGEVTTALAESSAAQLFALAAKSPDPIRVVLHSPGGHVEAGDTIFDVIRSIEPEVKMIATGWVASAGALIYCAAPKKNRLALPNTRFMLHQPSGGVRGPASDIEIEAKQIISVRERLNHIFAEATGQPYERIVQETKRNFWMNAGQALEYGLVARIVQRLADV